MATRARSRYQAAAHDLVRRTLLESARELLRERQWTEITMADIALRAGVSRQTLYNEFGSRRGFVQAYVLHDTDRILSAVEDAIASADGEPQPALERAFARFLEVVADDPLAITVLSGEDPDQLLALVTTRGGPVLEVAAARLGGAIAAMWPEAEPADVTALATMLVRLAISHAVLPGGRPISETATELARVLAPFAERALARSPA